MVHGILQSAEVRILDLRTNSPRLTKKIKKEDMNGMCVHVSQTEEASRVSLVPLFFQSRPLSLALGTLCTPLGA
jgi:hypothetical protein